MKLKSILMRTGMVAVFFYTLHIIIGGILWKDYSQLYQPISDLTSAGAPNRNLLLIFTTTYSIFALIFALSFSILASKHQNKFILWGGICYIIMHCISVSYGFFPEDLPNQQQTFSGTMHIVVTALIVPFTILSPLLIGIGFRKENKWKSLGTVSIITGILIIIFGGATAIFYANKLSYFGLVERLNIGVLQLWTFYFSYKLVTTK